MSNYKGNKKSEQILDKKNDKESFKKLECKIFKLFHQKYSMSRNFYGRLIINNIIYNEKSHIVAKFKDYLVIDDLSEFLKRFYKRKESFTRLPLYFEYYNMYSKIFPNYTVLKESKYIYTNIHRKQKMLDLQQEEEESEEKKKSKGKIKHQRKKNKNDINTIFNNDVYNSIIKQSQDLYMQLFGIEKNDKNNQDSFTSSDIKDIVQLIEQYDYDSKIRFNYKNNLIIPKINKKKYSKKIIKKENNSSLTTKQSTFNSSTAQKKMKNFGKFQINKDEIIIGLKKIKNEKKSITSNSLLISNRISKNNLATSHLKALTNNFINDKSKSQSKSKKKEIKKINKIKVNKGLLIDNKINYLTERANNRYKNLKFYFYNNSKIKKNINKITISNNNKIKAKLLNKKSTDFNYYSQIYPNNNANIFEHKRINTNTNANENITESSKYKDYKIKLLNQSKAKNTKNILENNNKLKLNLKEMRELIKNNKNPEKKFYTERESISSQKGNNKERFLQNFTKRINKHKKSFPSIDLKLKINKTLLLSQRIVPNSKNTKNKCNFKTNFLPLPFKENFKINKRQIMEMCNRKLSSYMNKIDDRNYYSERDSIQIPKKENIHDKVKLIISNDFPILKNIEKKYFTTTTNSKDKDSTKYKEKCNINKNIFQIKRINKGQKCIKRKEISPKEYNKKNILNNTERNKQILNLKSLLNKCKK